MSDFTDFLPRILYDIAQYRSFWGRNTSPIIVIGQDVLDYFQGTFPVFLNTSREVMNALCGCPYEVDEKIFGFYLKHNEDDILAQTKELLHKFGCTCPDPLLGYRPGVGPRCRLCNTVAKIEENNPTQ